MAPDQGSSDDVTVPLDALVGPHAPSEMHDFVRYWDSLRGSALLPAYRAVDPVDIPWALSRIYIVEAKDGDFVYRLAGEEVSERYDQSLKGKRIRDLFSEQNALPILRRWNRVVSGPSGYYSDTQHSLIHGSNVTARRLLLPLGADGQTADHFMGFTVFDETATDQDPFSDGLITTNIRWSDLRR